MRESPSWGAANSHPALTGPLPLLLAHLDYGHPMIDTADLRAEQQGAYDWLPGATDDTGEWLADVLAALPRVADLPLPERVDAINRIRTALHRVSPFAAEPVDCVLWIPSDCVVANDYNPNSVAPPEMELLEHSIKQDGYTQPIVSWPRDGRYEVVDGFHRNRVGKESPAVRERVHGYLPLTVVNTDRLDKGDRIAATIRHNRARGKHRVEAMSDIVIELKRRNWTTERVCKELGMDEDEVLRLCQITGLVELFSDQEFSRSWDVEGEVTEADFSELTEDVSGEFRKTVNVGGDRITHTYDKWECYRAGFHATTKAGGSKEHWEESYRAFLANSDKFEEALIRVTVEWKHSCEHYLTNGALNRVAWLGQAAACYALGIPAVYRGGYHLLTSDEQAAADSLALRYLNGWLAANGREPVSMEEGTAGGRQQELY